MGVYLFNSIYFYLYPLLSIYICKNLTLNCCFTYLRLTDPDNYEKETGSFIPDIRHIIKYELFIE